MANRCTAVLLAAGKGLRLGGAVPKQYRNIGGCPLLARSLAALAASPILTDLVLVIPEGDEAYIRRNILPAAEQLLPGTDLRIRVLVPGGAERYLSVLNGIRAIRWDCDYIFIHDGARPFIDTESIARLYAALLDPANGGTAVAAMPSKDTVKITDAQDYVVATPDRDRVWIIQTPQAFAADLIRKAYEKMAAQCAEGGETSPRFTDDAMLVEQLMHRKVRLVPASYRNIKITTPEDIPVAEALLAQGPVGSAERRA